MAIYSIRDLEKLSGIKAHTIRVWEQRYAILQPKRTETNIRYYQDEDIKFLLNVALLNRNGIKISKIAKMSKVEIAEKVATISDISFEHTTQLDALTISMIEMDEYKFDRIISMNIQEVGFERTMLEVIHPFLDKLSLLWLTGSINPVQEHFISYLIRQKIIVAIDQETYSPNAHTKKFLLYLPEGERQELSLLFLHYLLKVRGNAIIYLGQDISIRDLQDACQIHQPDYIYTMITESFAKQSVSKYLTSLAAYFPNSQILASGYQLIAQNIQSTEQVRVLSSLEQSIHFLDSLN